MIKLDFIKKNRQVNLKQGFTLLEALVAVSILMVAVVAPITIAQKGLSSATYSKSQMIASYLAQDAIEYIKNKRDFITINDSNKNDWGNLFQPGGFFDSCLADSYCEIDTNANNGDGEVKAYSLGDVLKIENGFYGFAGTTPTNFTRRIQIKLQPYGNPDEALITVTVGWGTSDSLTVKTLIFNY